VAHIFLDKAHPARYTLYRQVIRDPFVSRKAQAGFVILGSRFQLPDRPEFVDIKVMISRLYQVFCHMPTR